jgi:ABC-type oligopeptide transport system substrate-binding subunit
MNYTQMGLFDFVYDKDTDGYKAVPEMAASEAVDATGTLTEDEVEQYGLTKDEDNDALWTSGQKWVIDLNQAATWEDGTAIKADDYIYSMQQMINPQMQNFRGSSYTTGTASFGNADNYLKSGTTTYEWMAGYTGSNRSGTDYYFALWGTKYGTNIFGNAGYDAYTPGYIGESMAESSSSDDLATYATLIAMSRDATTYGTANDPKYVAITNENIELIAEAYSEFLAFFYGAKQEVSLDMTAPGSNSWAIGDFDYIRCVNPVTPWEKVGLVKTGEYQLTFYLVNPVSLFQFHYNFSSNWLVKEDLYEAGKKTVGTLITTTYGTTAASYSSYGPYKLESYQLDKDILMTRNDAWYGYNDGKHEGEFQIDNFDIQIVSSEDTILEMFMKGELDTYTIRSQDMEQLGGSSRLMYTPQSYTTKMTMNSSFSALKTEQDTRNSMNSTNYNHTILANLDFRHAISLGMDRSTLVQTQTAGSRAYDVPINTMYVCDENTGALYRNTPQAKKVVTDNFGTTEEGEPNYVGYDLDQARALINTAVTAEIAKNNQHPNAGYYDGTQHVELFWEVYNEGWATMVDFLKAQFATLFQGTLLEGKVEVTTTYNLQYADDIAAGNCDLAMSTWGGAEFDPYSIMQCYFDPSYKYEPGIDPATNLTLKPDGTHEVTKTLADWDISLRTGDYSASKANTETRLNVLAGCEDYLVGTYNFASLYARSAASLDSYRVQEGTTTYHQIVGYGGIRLLKLTQSDSEWADYVAQQGGRLPYGND